MALQARYSVDVRDTPRLPHIRCCDDSDLDLRERGTGTPPPCYRAVWRVDIRIRRRMNTSIGGHVGSERSRPPCARKLCDESFAVGAADQVLADESLLMGRRRQRKPGEVPVLHWVQSPSRQCERHTRAGPVWRRRDPERCRRRDHRVHLFDRISVLTASDTTPETHGWTSSDAVDAGLSARARRSTFPTIVFGSSVGTRTAPRRGVLPWQRSTA